MGDIGPVRTSYEVLPESEFAAPAPVADPDPVPTSTPPDPVAHEDELNAAR